MSEEQLKSFLEKVKVDTELQEKFYSASMRKQPLISLSRRTFSSEDDVQSMQSQTQSVELIDGELEGAVTAYLSLWPDRIVS